MLLPLSACFEAIDPVIRNCVTPHVTAPAIAQSLTPYFFPEIRILQSITGIILKLLPSICTGKDTHFNASYWQVVAATLLREIAKYFHRGALFTGDSWFTAHIVPANITAKIRLQSTRKTLALKSSPPYGTDITRSWMTP